MYNQIYTQYNLGHRSWWWAAIIQDVQGHLHGDISAWLTCRRLASEHLPSKVNEIWFILSSVAIRNVSEMGNFWACPWLLFTAFCHIFSPWIWQIARGWWLDQASYCYSMDILLFSYYHICKKYNNLMSFWACCVDLSVNLLQQEPQLMIFARLQLKKLELRHFGLMCFLLRSILHLQKNKGRTVLLCSA